MRFHCIQASCAQHWPLYTSCEHNVIPDLISDEQLICTAYLPRQSLQKVPPTNTCFLCSNLQGFRATLDAIVQNLPRERQTMLFSATQTKSVS